MKIFTLSVLFFYNYVVYSKNILIKNEIKRDIHLNKETCQKIHSGEKTWEVYCNNIPGASCSDDDGTAKCECKEDGVDFDPTGEKCKETCQKMQSGEKTWEVYCNNIPGASCSDDDGTAKCECKADGVDFDPTGEKCKETCQNIHSGENTWEEYCNNIPGASCSDDDGTAKCECKADGVDFDPTGEKCKEQFTCDSLIPGMAITWNQFCIERELLCEDEDMQPECLCPFGGKFDRSLMNCVRETCNSVQNNGVLWEKQCMDDGKICDDSNGTPKCVCRDEDTDINGKCIDISGKRKCKKICLNDGYCFLNNSVEVCICPSAFTGEYCQNPNFCKIHHQDGLSGEEYCEKGDAECISEENLVCRCYNPHRYFDYKTGMCINPCTTRPCRNGGRCIFKGTPIPTCECNPFFTGNRCEEVNWCRIKRIFGRTIERYCASNGAFCGIIGTGKVDCLCKDHDYEFNHSLQKCVEIDVCAVNRRGFQDCSLKNAICKKDILTKSGDKYVCECPSRRRMLENGTCAENTICEKWEKGYQICNRRRANCVINDFQIEGFECECEEGYAPNDHGRCIDINICTESHEGYEECESRDAICLHNFDNDVGYECGCKPGYKMTEIGTCIEINECDNGQIGYRECRAKNANCIQDLRNYKRYKCVCPERYVTDRYGRCRKNNFGTSYSFQTNKNAISYIDPCDEENPGYIECMKINAICTSKNNSYSCQCRPNQKLDSNGKCTALQPCDKGEIGFKECGILSSTCIQDKALLQGYKCECSQLHVVDQFGRCVNNVLH